MGAGSSVDPSTYAAMLATIRRRRWYFWGLVLVYLPITITILKLTQSTMATGIAFGIWVAFLCIAVALMACAKCPACNNSFHMRNGTLSFSRNCCHCGINYRQ
jgi:multidrug transporter EmrE-like cation transporter